MSFQALLECGAGRLTLESFSDAVTEFTTQPGQQVGDFGSHLIAVVPEHDHWCGHRVHDKHGSASGWLWLRSECGGA